MINLKYLFGVGKCGYFCLRKVIGKCKVDNKKYMSLLEIKETLYENGYECMCCMVDSIDDVYGECFSIIRIGNFNYHYVIIKGINSSNVFVYDPLFLMVRKINKSKFIKKWEKICLFFTKKR